MTPNTVHQCTHHVRVARSKEALRAEHMHAWLRARSGRWHRLDVPAPGRGHAVEFLVHILDRLLGRGQKDPRVALLVEAELREKELERVRAARDGDGGVVHLPQNARALSELERMCAGLEPVAQRAPQPG